MLWVDENTSDKENILDFEEAITKLRQDFNSVLKNYVKKSSIIFQNYINFIAGLHV
jgi:phosphotransferase system IIB component